jgi:ABC-type uncharacterized transport system substrate-binding protein
LPADSKGILGRIKPRTKPQSPVVAAFLAIAHVAFLLQGAAWADAADLGETALAADMPCSGPAAGPWKVAYFEPGPYRDYVMNLLGLAQGLEDLGLVASGSLPAEAARNSNAAWEWLSRAAGGDRLIFLADGFYSAGWDNAELPKIKRRLLERAENGEIDLILAFGTAAGQAMATGEHRTPTLSITATDPVAAGISETEERSGLDHVHVQVEAGRIERQLSMFHNTFGFKTLGVPYDLSAYGRSTMGVATIEKTAEKLGFELRTCQAALEIPNQEAATQNLIGCLQALSQESDAIYLTVSNAMEESSMAQILAPMIEKGLPTFSQKGPAETRLGVLMSLAEDDFVNSGRFEADVVCQILSGRQPGSIGQIYAAPLTLALNIKMAMAIGWNPPFEILAGVDEFYSTMAAGPNSAPGPGAPQSAAAEVGP